MLLFYAFHVMREQKYLNKKRELAERFASGDTFSGFDEIDRQYLLDIAALVLRSHLWEETKEDLIHQITNHTPDKEGVNELLTQAFWVTVETPAKYQLDNNQRSLIEWYIANLKNIPRANKGYLKKLIVLLGNFKNESTTYESLQFILEALHYKAIDSYAGSFTVPDEELKKEPLSVPNRLANIAEMVESILENKPPDNKP